MPTSASRLATSRAACSDACVSEMRLVRIAHARLHVVLHVVLHVASVKGPTEQHGDYT